MIKSEILRPGLLDGLSVCIESLEAVRHPQLPEHLEELGAELAERGDNGAGALVLDCSSWSAGHDEPGPDGAEPLLNLLDGVWSSVLALAVDGFIAGGRGGRIIFVAPAAGASALAAALENLARTLSVEWARHSITAVTLVPATDTDPEHLATLVAYLLSPAGAYFSGARLDLDSLRRPDG
ncbi:MAG TPA: hypothetical protein VG405_04750 [Solirubrobacteraceae bacterium]|jgi:hypothetical protein|nr:hypothetical protein [Solirubrobacteraceae bacterium]